MYVHFYQLSVYLYFISIQLFLIVFVLINNNTDVFTFICIRACVVEFRCYSMTNLDGEKSLMSFCV